MGCTSSSLKGDFGQAEALARPSKVSSQPLSSASAQPDPNAATQQVSNGASEKPTMQTPSKKSGSQSKKAPPSDEELLRTTGMTAQQLQEWGDQRIRYANVNKVNSAGSWGANAVNANMGMGAAAMGAVAPGF